VVHRDALLTQAETARRQGKVAAAIDAYALLVDQRPNDWSSLNALGDLYAASGDANRAAACFARVADHYYREGFFPRASAAYKKVLKFSSTDDHALSQLVETALRQGLTLDARAHLERLLAVRRRSTDESGVADCLVRLANLDAPPPQPRTGPVPAPADHDQSNEAFESALAAVQVSTHADLERSGRTEATVSVVGLEAVFGDMRARAAHVSTEARAAVLYEWADALERLGETDSAIEVLEELDATQPDYRDVRERRARWRSRDGGAQP